MTTATIQPAAWRVSMGTTADHNYWHYFGKKPKTIDDGEIWEPLYSASTLESLQRENEALKKDRDFWKEQFQVETRYRIELADRGTLLALTDANSRAEAAEAEVKRYRVALIAAKTRMRNCRGAIESDQVVDKDVHGSLQNGIRDIQDALASTGGEHHAE
ncbi:hypothetical protein [Agrobacterium pusense]|uniref:hypothetical protein n=1 Tax=Agrobacterium pusense TaxID=648995 RepID=UPI0009281E20|nr:hypothetical protein [Agrobacterium pusense]MDH1268597.1 hypothetical protein [Agrobacterium pusense]OJH53239.1 hypothetical protein ATN81_19205 [Agrobacterium pusense]OJH57634.1 hypothetical protein BA725_21105 [Agrobacterium pusense]